jgi:hypothetical protein
MSNSRTKPARSAPLSIRFTDSEKAILTRKAGGMPLGTYIKGVVLAAPDQAPRMRRAPVRDSEALGQVLARLGQSRVANNLNQLAKAANLGALPVTQGTEDDLREACAAILEMRALLLRALGIEIMTQVMDAPSLVEAFSEAAEDRRS